MRSGFAAVMLCLAGYGAAGMVGGAIPVDAGRRRPTQGIRVYVESNGVHVGLVVPTVAAGIDWRGVFAARDIADPRYAAYDHLAIGWGERGFYLGTPDWTDIRPLPVLRAALGSDATLLHVEHVPAPAVSASVRAVMMSPVEYRRLAAFMRRSLVAGGARHPGYAAHDVFYQARGRYDAVHDCNAWVGDGLRAAGVRIGWWTPFPVTVLGWFPQ